MNAETLGKRIVFHRKRLGWTQDALAEKLGVTAQAVSKWENDQSCPDISMLPRLAKLFGISTDTLLGLEDPVIHEVQILEEENEPEGLHIQSGNMELTMDPGKNGALGLAVWILLAGALLLASNILGWECGLWDILWPTALVSFGLFGLWPKFSFFRFGCLLIGGYYALTNAGILHYPVQKNWILPIWLLLFGMSLLGDALKKKQKGRFTVIRNGKKASGGFYQEDGECFRTGLSFGEQSRKLALPRLAGGDVELSFGEMALDLTGCGEIAEGCTLNVNCAFGELELLVPRGCVVKSNVTSSFGSLDVKGRPAPGADRTINLDGSVSFGSITLAYDD